MPRQPMKPISVPPAVYDRLKARMHPHQAISGVIEELLDLSDKVRASDQLVSKPDKEKSE